MKSREYHIIINNKKQIKNKIQLRETILLYLYYLYIKMLNKIKIGCQHKSTPNQV